MASKRQARQMALVGFMQAGNATVYAGSWRHPANEPGFLDHRYYQKLGRTEDAITEYTAALDTDARNPVALANRGELRLKAGDRAGFKDLAKAVEADPYGETAAGRRAKGLVKAITMAAVQVAKAR